MDELVKGLAVGLGRTIDGIPDHDTSESSLVLVLVHQGLDISGREVARAGGRR